MSLGTTYSPAVPVGGAASYKLWPEFTYSNGYWEVYRRFSLGYFWFGRESWGGGYVGGSFHGGTSHGGEETFNEGGVGFSSMVRSLFFVPTNIKRHD